jgi:predicted DCC family thiol-disulfide oxidoreductase YuxK
MAGKRPVITVAAHPAKPLLIYDGDCNFCKFWILRWQRFTRGRVEYLASEDARVAEQFPELPRERFDESVQFIETDGRVYGGAEAVFRSLNYGPAGGVASWVYEGLPGFAAVAEGLYRFVAKRRTLFSFLTRLLWGREGALPSYRLTGWVFLRFLGVIYLCAFASLGTQIIGLIGKNGILPAARLMDSAREQFDGANIGLERYHELPTLCWLGVSDGFLRMLCVAGCALSILLIANIAPAPCLFLLWLIYLSLASVCREFLSFQWDALLLETGLLAIFFAPLQLFPKLSKSSGPSRIILWMLRWLLFRLMLESGLVKLISLDPTWQNGSALTYHYETQPLPTWIGWYAHQLPAGLQHVCVVIMFIIELCVPYLIFLPRRLRILGCWLLLLLQVLILLTGNYCFFNWLTIALCLLLLDDAAMQKLVPAKWRRLTASEMPTPGPANSTGKTLGEITVPSAPVASEKGGWRWPVWVTLPLALVILFITVPQLWTMLHGYRGRSAWSEPLSEWLAPFSSVNGYGLFAVMTTTRPEIIIEGSNDGKNWREYEFKYKAGDLKRRPMFVAPHQPRLDWQMWFAALGDYRQNRWFLEFCRRLLEGSPDVLKLMGRNPFPDAPPRYIRAQLYEYHFSNFKQRHADGVWWRREFDREYLPPVSLGPRE